MDYKETYEDYTINFSTKILELKQKTHEISDLFIEGKGSKAILKELNLPEEDFRGLYCFWKDGKVEYVGISRKVINRLGQHIKGTTHQSATLPIKILKIEQQKKYGKTPRKSFTATILKKAQTDHLHKMKISFVEIEDDLELYLFEAYCAIYFKCKYNDFKTH